MCPPPPEHAARHWFSWKNGPAHTDCTFIEFKGDTQTAKSGHQLQDYQARCPSLLLRAVDRVRIETVLSIQTLSSGLTVSMQSNVRTYADKEKERTELNL